MYFSTIATVFGLAAGANAHMLLAYPPPFPGNQNGPLGAGLNFPCQGKMSGGSSTSMALGSTQKLTFQGGATHGGGSCQVALTNEKAPTAATKFRVITSIEGGCPIASPGNYGNDASAALDSGLQFKVPSDIPAGDYILSWTWINQIGNREFYMNCAPVTLTGTGGAASNLDKLPEIFVTNTPNSNTCKTPEGKDYIYPNPGAVVFRKGDPAKLMQLTCPASTPGGQPGAQPAPSTGDQPSAPSNGSQPSDSNKPKTPSPPTAPKVGTPGNGVKAPAPVPAPGSGAGNGTNQPSTPSTPSPAPEAPQPAVPATPAPAPVTPPAPATPPPATGGDSSSGGGCTPGMYKCIGGNSFQQCTAGKVWATKMQMAAGTKCDSGVVSASLFSLTKREVTFRA